MTELKDFLPPIAAQGRELSQQRDDAHADGTWETSTIWSTFSKRWKLITFVTLLCGLLGFLYNYMLYPRYTATAIIKVTNNKSIANVGADVDLFTDDAWTKKNTSKSQLLGQGLGKRVIADANLLTEKEFMGQFKQRSLVPSLVTIARTLLNKPKPAVEQTPSRANNIAGSIYAKNVSTFEVKNTNLIELSYTSFNAKHAALVANTVVKSFNDMEYEEEQHQAGVVLDRLNAELVDVQEKLRISEKKLTAFSRETGILDLSSENNPEQLKIDSLSSELLEVKSKRVKLESMLQSLKKADNQVAAYQRLSPNERIQRVRSLLAEAEDERNEMARSFKDGYPPMKKLNQKVANLRSRLNQELAIELGALEFDYQFALKREKTLQADLDSKQATMLDFKDQSVAFNFLKREWESNKNLYAGLLEKVKRASLASSLTREGMTLVQAARVPGSASSPNIPQNTIMMASAGLLLGIALAFMLQLLSNRFKSLASLEQLSGLPMLGIVHHIDKAKDRSKVALQSLIEPMGPTAEAYRSVNANIAYALTDQGGGNALMITSSAPGEGKTCSVVNMAINFAANGKQVALVDFDLRKPSIHQALGMKREDGVYEALTAGRVVMQRTDQENLFALTSGSSSSNPVKLLESPECSKLIQALKKRFDYVLIDAGPVLGLADSVVLSQHVDAILIAVDPSKTSKNSLSNALSRLSRVNAPLVGLIVTNYMKGVLDDDAYNYSYEYYEYGT